MTDSPETTAPATENAVPTAPAGVERPEELPSVEPPSAGYIVQLFLIPALIVAAVIGVWALFGKLADSETNVEQLVQELGGNKHRSWRAALELAQLLRSEQVRPDESGVPLAQQPELAEGLIMLLKKPMESGVAPEDRIKRHEFLVRTLGSLDQDDVVLPALADALAADQDPELRKSSLMSLAMITGRHFQRQAETLDTTVQKKLSNGEPVYMLAQPLSEPTISDQAVWGQIKQAAQDEDPSIRHLAAFVAALVSGEDAMEVLRVLLLDGDTMARANAAVGFARNGRTDGVKVLTQLLTDDSTEMSPDEFNALSPEEQKKALSYRQFDQPRILSNCLHAVDMLWAEKLTDEERNALRPVLQKLAEDSSAADIRLLANSIAGAK